MRSAFSSDGDGALSSPQDEASLFRWRPGAAVLLAVVVLAGLIAARMYSYLLFHSLVELSSVVVAWSIFALAWNSRGLLDNGYFLVVGVASLFVGGLDLVHTLAYRVPGETGAMDVFRGYDSNLPTQLWIVARYMESISLLLAAALMSRRLRPRLLLAVYAAVTAMLLFDLFYLDLFPDCFVQGAGLTPFKKISEYVICLILVAAIVLLARGRQRFERPLLGLIIASIVITIASELMFTAYRSPDGPANFAGHYLKLASFFLIYVAVVRTGIVQPHRVLFRSLKQSEEALRKAADELERRVLERTVELEAANQQLRQEVQERKQAVVKLHAERLRLFSVLHLLPGYVTLHGKDYQIRFANRRFVEIFGEPGEKPCYNVLRGLDRPCVPCHVTEILGSGQAAEWEWKSAAGRIYHVWGYPFSDIDGAALVLELGIDVTEQMRLEKEILEISEMERQRIGQDLHDTVGQRLTGAAFLSRVLADTLAGGQAEQSSQAATIEEVLNQAISETRAISRGLCPVETNSEGLVNALQELAADVQGIFGVRCVLRHDVALSVEDAVAATHLYRIAQESVNNAMRHGKARNVTIELSGTDEEVSLRVTDDGQGFPEEWNQKKGVGLRSMRYRADLIGARLHIRANPAGGTIVECTLRRGRSIRHGM